MLPRFASNERIFSVSTVFEEAVASCPGVPLAELCGPLAARFDVFPLPVPGAVPAETPDGLPPADRPVDGDAVRLAAMVLLPKLGDPPSTNVWFVPDLDGPFLYRLGLLLVTGVVPGPIPDHRAYVLLRRVAAARAGDPRGHTADDARLAGVQAYMSAKFDAAMSVAYAEGVASRAVWPS
jgi:hypothetical protein